MNKRFIKGLLLSAAPLALVSSAAFADNTFLINGYGSSLSSKALNNVATCATGQTTPYALFNGATFNDGTNRSGIASFNFTSAAGYPPSTGNWTSPGDTVNCVAPLKGSLSGTSGVADGYVFSFLSGDSGLALESFVNNTVPADTNYHGIYTPDLLFSDAPLDVVDPFNNGTNRFVDLLTSSVTDARGAPFQFPVAAAAVAIPYNPGAIAANSASTLVFNNLKEGAALGGVEGTAPALNGTTVSGGSPLKLSKDMLCYIFTKATAAGKIVKLKLDTNGEISKTGTAQDVTGNYTWANPIFSSLNNGSTTGGITRKVVQLTGPGTTATPIVPFFRSDASGTTYLFTLYLGKTCKSYGVQYWGNAGTQKPFMQAPVGSPAFNTVTGFVKTSFTAVGATTTTNISGSGGMVNAVKSLPGSVGYVSPSSIEPLVANSVPAAYLQNAAGKYVYPTVGGTQAAIQKTPAPSIATSDTTFPGSSLDVMAGYTNPYYWGSPLNASIFKYNKASVYPISGLTYAYGFQCNQGNTSALLADSTGGIKAFFNALHSATGQRLLSSVGLVGMTADTGKTKGLNNASFVGVISGYLNGTLTGSDVGTTANVGALTPVSTLASAPAVCPTFNTASGHVKPNA